MRHKEVTFKLLTEIAWSLKTTMVTDKIDQNPRETTSTDTRLGPRTTAHAQTYRPSWSMVRFVRAVTISNAVLEPEAHPISDAVRLTSSRNSTPRAGSFCCCDDREIETWKSGGKMGAFGGRVCSRQSLTRRRQESRALAAQVFLQCTMVVIRDKSARVKNGWERELVARGGVQQPAPHSV